MSAPQIGTGTSVRFLTSGFNALARRIVITIGRERFIATSFSETVAQVYSAKSIYEVASIELEILFDPLDAPLIPVTGGAELVQIVYPNAMSSCSGFVTAFKFNAQVEELLSASVKIKGSGPITYYGRTPVMTTSLNWVYTTSGNLVYHG